MQIALDVQLSGYSALTTLTVGFAFLVLWRNTRLNSVLYFGLSFSTLGAVIFYITVCKYLDFFPYRDILGAGGGIVSSVFLLSGCLSRYQIATPWRPILGIAAIAWISVQLINSYANVLGISYVPGLVGLVSFGCGTIMLLKSRGRGGKVVGLLLFVRSALLIPWPFFFYPKFINLILALDQIMIFLIGLSLLVIELLRARAELAEANLSLREQAHALEIANEKLGVERQLAVSASNAKSAFLANMSHELRTPLNAIMGFSEIIAQSPAEQMAERYTGYGKDIHQAACVLLDFVDQVLELSRIEANRIDFNPETLDVEVLVSTAINAARLKAGSSPAEIIRYFEEGTGSVEGDENLLKQALSGILIRALRFTGTRGSVHVSAGPKPEDAVHIEVKDSGPRLSDTQVADAFNPFNITNASVTQVGGGIDLSLPLAKRFVEAHGGEISIDNKMENGTIVSINLPRRLLLH
ncbi:HAMP domain-containing sensor histidine kinase [Nisaea sp.]|uniref:sensor histidine kinase n=1 Tax=Nisaea sp. TaxID=2024842 RepID=UPI002B265709|nr:HAMP domain-containing sensor histidine kinase [Nisaea sp.]